MTMSTESPFEPLQCIGQNIYLHEPQSEDHELHDSPSVSPSLVILCTWLGGATPRRINKYVMQYRRLFPKACILLVNTTLADISIRSFSAVRSRLTPARDAIGRIISSSTVTPQPDIVLHIFSHGGSNTAIQLAHYLRESDMNFSSLLRGIIFDCCPGDTTFKRAYDASALSLPTSQPVQSIGRALLYPAIGVITSLQHVGLMSSVTDLRRELNNPMVFGNTAKRMYIYSKADRVVRWQDVEKHMEEARGEGYAVEGVIFHNSDHCALILEDRGRYCNAIQRIWGLGSSHVEGKSDMRRSKL